MMKSQIYLLMILSILIITRTLHKIEIYRNNFSAPQVELEILWRGDGDTCWQSQNDLLIYLPDCFTYPAGSYLRVIGSLQPPGDSKKISSKIVMVQSIQPIVYHRVSVKYLFSLWWQKIANLRRNMLDQLRWILGYSGGSLLFSLVLGGIKNLPDDLQIGIHNLGLMYIFSASGMHVGILLEMVAKRIGKWSGLCQLMAQIIILFIYSSLTLWRPAIIRSCLMATYRLLAKHLWLKPTSPLLSLGWTVILMLWINSLWWLDLAFWMSVLATGAILFVSQAGRLRNQFFIWETGGNELLGGDAQGSKKHLLGRNFFSKIIIYTRETMLFSLTAQLAILPLVIKAFGDWSLVGFVSSWLVLWSLPFIFRLGAVSSAVLMIINLSWQTTYYLITSRGVWLPIIKLLTLPIRGWLNNFSQVLSGTGQFTWMLMSQDAWSTNTIWMWYIGWCMVIFIWKIINNYWIKVKLGKL